MKTDFGEYLPTNITEELKTLFSKYVTGKRFLDLGAGDGRIVKLALEYSEKSYGVEGTEGINFFDLNLGDYEVLYYYLDGCKDEGKLFQKILDEFKGILILNLDRVNLQKRTLPGEDIESLGTFKVRKL